MTSLRTMLQRAPVMLLLAVALLSGCATRQAQVPAHITDPAVQTKAQELWERYVADAETRAEQAGPFRINASLRYSTPDSGHRLVLRAWGNGIAPVRMDIEAGVGKTLALIRQDTHSFIAYDPREGRAFVNNNSGSALLRLGLPVPFGISDLGHLMAGRFTKVFPEKYLYVDLVPEGGFAYTLSAVSHEHDGSEAVEGVLKLSPEGRPTEWSVGTGDKRMVLSMNNFDETDPTLPGKFSIALGTDRTAVLLIKERTPLDEPFAAQQLKLDLPEGTQIKPLPDN
ncbi:hypothetical protein LN040_03625 [Desulfovibrio subterraneus]|uniref:hypothetical protein n=1 Tax=Desulfovibrio subterraneus TaxID=2718620 RepID=UPI0022B8BF74|nr:hypothetical protein [Desulfovibrio subterraneus]WBF68206.1 hypothetical protein LN040_03625 [Desulfovibrio subterraneus]